MLNEYPDNLPPLRLPGPVVLVCGGRDYADADTVARVLGGIEPTPDAIIHGGARGADQLAGEWARAHGIRVHVYPADWGLHGKVAGPIRNSKMLREGKPDIVVAFPGGRGTADMVSKARKAGVLVRTVAA